MKILRIGMTGSEVELWQNFLIGQGLLAASDGLFGPATEDSTKRFQRAHQLNYDGVVGRMTIAMAVTLGFLEADDDPGVKVGSNWPPPAELKFLSGTERERIFGKFAFVSEPQPNNPEAIRITDNWPTKNLEMVIVPQLQSIAGTNKGNILFHRKAAKQLVNLWKAWETEGLLDHVLTWNGSYVSRYVRGSRTYLSNHSFGTAFDINASWNPLGAEPARVGKQGSVRELVELANYYGFAWGGHMTGRPDGMHFEVAKIV